MSAVVRVELPDPVWGRLVSRADHAGVKVADLIGAAIAREVRADRPATGRERVRDLWAQGLPDRLIAAELGWLNGRVAVERRALGLRPNRLGRGV